MRLFLKLIGMLAVGLVAQVGIEFGVTMHRFPTPGPFTRPMRAEQAATDLENERFNHLTLPSRWILSEMLNMPWDNVGPGPRAARPCVRPDRRAEPRCQTIEPADLSCD